MLQLIKDFILNLKLAKNLTNKQTIKQKKVVPHHVGPKFSCWSMVERYKRFAPRQFPPQGSFFFFAPYYVQVEFTR